MLKRLKRRNASLASMCLVAGLLSLGVTGYAKTYSLRFHRETSKGGYTDHRGFTITAAGGESRYCVKDVSPSSAALPADGKSHVDIKISNKPECRYLYQFFYVTLDPDPSCKAVFSWVKGRGKTPRISYTREEDSHFLIHLHTDRSGITSWSDIYIGRDRPDDC